MHVYVPFPVFQEVICWVFTWPYGLPQDNAVKATADMYNVPDLSEVDRRLLRMRCRHTQEISTVCSHHYTMFVKRYTTHMASKWCSNPFLKHVKNVRGTCIITTAMADLQPTLELIPGKRLCVTCKRMCYTTPKATSSEGALQESDAD